MPHENSEVEDTVIANRGDDDLDATIVRPSRRRAANQAAPEPEPDIEETVIAGRRHRAPAGAAHDADAVDETIIVDRGGYADDVEETIIVDRGADDVDETIIAGHRRTRPLLGESEDDDDTDRTVARPSQDDETIIVDRSTPSASLPPVPSLRRARTERRRGIAPPPIPAGFAPAARPAVGPGATETYTPRELKPPPPAPVIPEGAAATRVSDPSLPSVARRARQTSVVAIAAFVAACVVSVTGLALILLWAL